MNNLSLRSGDERGRATETRKLPPPAAQGRGEGQRLPVVVSDEMGALGENFPEAAPSSQTASTLIDVLNTSEQAIL
jgi:hypothetical protein